MIRAIVLSVLMVCAAVTGGCKDETQQDVIAQYQLGEDAIAAGDSLGLYNTFSTDSVARMQEIIRAAKECSVQQTKQLPPSMMALVLALRNRCDAKRLKTMTPQDMLAWEIEQEMLSVDADYDCVPHSVTVRGDTACIQMGVKVEGSRGVRVRTGRRGAGLIGSAIGLATSSGSKVEPIEGWRYNFVRVNGWWYADHVTDWNEMDIRLASEAQESQMSIPDFLAAVEEEEAGKLKSNIWAPVK